MGMRINTNVEAFNAQRNLANTAVAYSKSVEKLSSGLRINRAGDDAAGLSISEKLRAQTRGLAQAQRNAQDGISMLQTGEGALNETHSILQRVNELAVQASNGTLNTDDQQAIAAEMVQLRGAIDDLGNQTQFNGYKLLQARTQLAGNSQVYSGHLVTSGAAINVDVSSAIANRTFMFSGSTSAQTLTLTDTTTGESQTVSVADIPTAGTSETLDFSQFGVKIGLTSAGPSSTGSNIVRDLVNDNLITTGTNQSVTYQVGANAGEQLTTMLKDMRSSAIGASGGVGSLWDAIAIFAKDANNAASAAQLHTDATNVLNSVQQAVTDVSAQRAVFGAAQNRLEHTISNLGVAQENTMSAESRIRDVDMAAEMVNFTKTGILQQAGQAILAQANQSGQGILSLLRG